MTTFADINARRTRRRRTAWVVLDQAVYDQAAELSRRIEHEATLDEALNREPVAPRLRRELEEMQHTADQDAVPFVFEEIPRREFQQMIDAHPSKKKEERWSQETFPPALLAAACVDPPLTEADAATIWNDWGQAVAWELFAAAFAVQEDPSRVPFTVNGSAGTPGSEPSSTTAPSEE